MTANQKGFHCSSHEIGACFISSQLGNGSYAVGCHMPTLTFIAACNVINFLALCGFAVFPERNT